MSPFNRRPAVPSALLGYPIQLNEGQRHVAPRRCPMMFVMLRWRRGAVRTVSFSARPLWNFADVRAAMARCSPLIMKDGNARRRGVPRITE